MTITSNDIGIDADIVAYARNLPSGAKLRDEARKFVENAAGNPAWAEWVLDNVIEMVHDRIRATLKSERAKAFHQGRRDDARSQILDPDVAALEVMWPYRIDDEWRHLHLGDMTRVQVSTVADDYSRRSSELALRSAFLREIAKRVPEGGVVRDVFTNEQLARLWEALAE